MQVAAIIRAALAVRERTGQAPELEIMMPLVAYERELELMRELVERVVAANGGGDLHLTVGTMIELPRACFVADRIAEEADFFSFGTNDLTQTALGFSATTWRASSWPATSTARSSTAAPSRRSTSPASGWLVRLAAWTGREAKPGPQARHLRRARRRPGLDRLLPARGPRLRELLALPRADRAGGRGAGRE